MSPAHFAFVSFQMRSYIYTQAGLDSNPLIYVSHIAGMTGVHHHSQLLLVEIETHKLFAQAGLEP
jgi:hypothetical protein